MNDLIVLPRLEHYFRVSENLWYLDASCVGKAFTRDRYCQIKHYIHFEDPHAQHPRPDDPTYDQLHKIRPLVLHLQQKFYDLYAPEKEISIDESMVPFKGHVIFKQHMSQKPVKFGIKLWMLCESETGYCSKFDVYVGKEAGAANNGVIGKTGTIVTRLCRGFEHRGYKLSVDNFHTGVPLFLKLSEMGIQACGAIRSNRKFYPSELVQEAKQLNQGQFTWKTFGTLVAMVWKDRKPVYFLSSIHDPVEGEPVTRNMKDNNNRHIRAAVACPKLVNDYNMFMGGVDLNDQQACIQISYSPVSRLFKNINLSNQNINPSW